MEQGVVEWAYFEGWLLDVYYHENNEYSPVLSLFWVPINGPIRRPEWARINMALTTLFQTFLTF